jgi:5'-nucleotidase
MKKTIAIDMDGVIADIDTHFINWYERDYGIRILPENILGLTTTEAFPNGAVRKFVYTPGFFLTAPVMPGAVEALKTLSESFEIYIVSAAVEFPQSLSEKLQWLNINFPFITWKNIVFCGDKSIINTDFMIDDMIRNLDTFKGETLMFNSIFNYNHNHHRRVNTWQEVVELMKDKA